MQSGLSIFVAGFLCILLGSRRVDQLKRHLYDFVNAYNFAKRFKMFKGLTPYEFIIKVWQSEPERFINNPLHHNAGLYKLISKQC